jgi:4-hydroxy-tetrahydrodipicolinate synthase
MSCHNHPGRAAEWNISLSLSAAPEGSRYPKPAKRFHGRIGIFTETHNRTIADQASDQHCAVEGVLDCIVDGATRVRDRIKSLLPATTD